MASHGVGLEEPLMTIVRSIPMMPVADVAISIAFYSKLGFTAEQRRDDWGWAMLRCGECRIMLDRSINVQPGARRLGVLYLYPDDVREFHREARANGLEVPELDTTFYGMLEFRLDDPDGTASGSGRTARPLAGIDPAPGPAQGTTLADHDSSERRCRIRDTSISMRARPAIDVVLLHRAAHQLHALAPFLARHLERRPRSPRPSPRRRTDSPAALRPARARRRRT